MTLFFGCSVEVCAPVCVSFCLTQPWKLQASEAFFPGLKKENIAHAGLQRYFFVVNICRIFRRNYGLCPTFLQVTCPCLLRSSCANLFYVPSSQLYILITKNFIDGFKSWICSGTHQSWQLSHKLFNWVASIIIVLISCPRTTKNNTSLFSSFRQSHPARAQGERNGSP